MGQVAVLGYYEGSKGSKKKELLSLQQTLGCVWGVLSF